MHLTLCIAGLKFEAVVNLSQVSLCIAAGSSTLPDDAPLSPQDLELKEAEALRMALEAAGSTPSGRHPFEPQVFTYSIF